ncbi:MAG: SAM-dependent methyltransferase, partial [Planctomycetota bacterium]
FILPPFSILDARQGYWQERKNDWLSLGIKSELGGRDQMKVTGALSGSVPQYYTYKEQAEKRVGRKLSCKEFEEKHLKRYLPTNSNIAFTETGGLLSIFDPVLCEIAYRWFCPANAIVLDPFAGGSVRGIVASSLGYDYVGIELRKEQVEENRRQAEEILDEKKAEWATGDSLEMDSLVSGEFDFIFSCPPYADLEVYSDDPKDLSNMDYSKFKSVYQEIIRKSVEKLKNNRFACFVVGDVRDKTGVYRNFVGHTIQAFIDAGMSLYNEAVLITPLGSVPMRVGRQFQAGRKLGKAHQNVLVFYKGDPKAIKQEFGSVEIREDDD